MWYSDLLCFLLCSWYSDLFCLFVCFSVCFGQICFCVCLFFSYGALAVLELTMQSGGLPTYSHRLCLPVLCSKACTPYALFLWVWAGLVLSAVPVVVPAPRSSWLRFPSWVLMSWKCRTESQICSRLSLMVPEFANAPPPGLPSHLLSLFLFCVTWQLFYIRIWVLRCWARKGCPEIITQKWVVRYRHCTQLV